jgi:hypothetical protein
MQNSMQEKKGSSSKAQEYYWNIVVFVTLLDTRQKLLAG